MKKLFESLLPMRLGVSLFTWDRFALLVAGILALVIVIDPIHDHDLYWHLANGREMLNAGRVVSEEVFSYTHPGEKFANHEWLSQIILYLVWNNLGPYGLFCFKLLVAVLVVLLLYRTIRMVGGQPGLAAVLCAFAVLVGVRRYVERPELFSLFNTALLSFILYGFRSGHLPRRWLWLIPLILVVWDWLHGSVYGFVLFVLFVAGENAKHLKVVWRHEQLLSKDDLTYLNRCFGVAMLAMLVNPFGLRSYGIFVEFMSDKGVVDMASKIVEFMPINWADFKPYILLLTLAVLLVLRHIRRIDITQMLILLVFGYAAVRYNRVTAVAAIVIVPVVASLMVSGVQNAKSVLELRLQAAAVFMLAIFTVGYGYIVKFREHTVLSFGYRVYEEDLPVGSVRFIKTMGLTGNLYNHGNFGSYLSYYITPERKIFQYNLPKVFGDPFRFPEHPAELDKWNINYAIAGNDEELNILFPVQDWARVYRDPEAVLVVRRTPQNQELIRLYEIRYFRREVTDDDLRAMANNIGALPRLTYEMGVYLAYRQDERITWFWSEILAAWPELRNQPHIQQLLKEALKYNHSDKLAQMVS